MTPDRFDRMRRAEVGKIEITCRLLEAASRERERFERAQFNGADDPTDPAAGAAP
jgi:hypothetical protein